MFSTFAKLLVKFLVPELVKLIEAELAAFEAREAAEAQAPSGQ